MTSHVAFAAASTWLLGRLAQVATPIRPMVSNFPRAIAAALLNPLLHLTMATNAWQTRRPFSAHSCQVQEAEKACGGRVGSGDKGRGCGARGVAQGACEVDKERGTGEAMLRRNKPPEKLVGAIDRLEDKFKAFKLQMVDRGGLGGRVVHA